MAGKNKYTFNENYFDVLTPESAYFLGLMYADGFVSKEDNLVLLSLTDKDLIYKFREAINSNHPIKIRPAHANKKEIVRISVYSAHLKSRLIELGCTPLKTFDLKFPDFLPDDLLRHFVRGYMDGDGSISKDGKNLSVSFTGTEELLAGINVKLKSLFNFNVKLTTRYPERGNNIRSVCYKGNVKVGKLLAWLYKDSTVYMQRKRWVADNFMREYAVLKPAAVEVVYEDCYGDPMLTSYDFDAIKKGHSPVIVTCLGWLVRQDKKGITLFTEIHDSGDTTYRGQTFVPTSMIKELNYLTTENWTT